LQMMKLITPRTRKERATFNYKMFIILAIRIHIIIKALRGFSTKGQLQRLELIIITTAACSTSKVTPNMMSRERRSRLLPTGIRRDPRHRPKYLQCLLAIRIQNTSTRARCKLLSLGRIRTC
jgi:hypothetical protein